MAAGACRVYPCDLGQQALARHERGQSMVEFLIVLPSLLLIVFGILQFALIYQARGALNHAAFVGARQGALSGASLTSIRDGVASGLTPLFMRLAIGADPAMSDLVRARQIANLEILNPNSASIEILNPTVAAFNDLNINGVIPNDHLMYRSASGGGVSIQDANLLKIQVTYCFNLVVPFVNQLLYGMHVGLTEVKKLTGIYFDMAGRVETRGNLCSTINNLGGVRIPITAESTVRMQTPFAPSG